MDRAKPRRPEISIRYTSRWQSRTKEGFIVKLGAPITPMKVEPCRPGLSSQARDIRGHVPKIPGCLDLPHLKVFLELSVRHGYRIHPSSHDGSLAEAEAWGLGPEVTGSGQQSGLTSSGRQSPEGLCFGDLILGVKGDVQTA